MTPPALPIEQSTRATFSLIAYGYHVAPKDKGACPRVAALMELRLTRALHVEEPLTMGMQVRCMSLRGNTFLMALASSESLNASTLPDRMQLAFEQLGMEPPTAAEEKLMDRHAQRPTPSRWRMICNGEASWRERWPNPARAPSTRRCCCPSPSACLAEPCGTSRAAPSSPSDRWW
ncbi:hypothetical protein ACN28S_50515 [Cystobacter fuscus]